MLNDWQLVFTPEPLLDTEVHVWCADLRISPQKFNEMWGLLINEEKNQANKFISTHAKENFIVSRGILRSLLSKYLKIPSEKLILKKGKYGKPYVQPGETKQHIKQSPLQFNISHSGDLALFAFTLHRNIGVDIELIKKDFVYEEIAPQFFSKQESTTLFSLPKNQQKEAFFNCWTRKEAFIKAIGEGLSFPLDKFDVDFITTEENHPLPIHIHNVTTQA